nr:GIY endonuclease [Ophiocordyceps lanpingensis]
MILMVIKENRNKTGVYYRIHLETARRYVGSSVNLGKLWLAIRSMRAWTPWTPAEHPPKNIFFFYSSYYNYNHLSSNNMLICKALSKYGYSAFRLEISELCSLEELLDREQYYINKYKPEFNILKIHL